MITKFKLYEDITQYKEGNLKVLYRDSNLTLVVPLTSGASDVTCRGTKWCSIGRNYYNWASGNVLFRFLFKDGYKLRLTWNIFLDEFTFGSGGEKYKEIRGKNPFSEKEIKLHYKDIEKEYLKLKSYSSYQKDREYYDDVYRIKKEIMNRVRMIPLEARRRATEYRDKVMKDKNENM